MLYFDPSQSIHNLATRQSEPAVREGNLPFAGDTLERVTEARLGNDFEERGRAAKKGSPFRAKEKRCRLEV
jgi:hypothetical protein